MGFRGLGTGVARALVGGRRYSWERWALLESVRKLSTIAKPIAANLQDDKVWIREEINMVRHIPEAGRKETLVAQAELPNLSLQALNKDTVQFSSIT